MFKVLVTGAQGQVGSELIKSAPSNFTVIGLKSNELDITNALQIKAAMAKYQPDLIINSAAYTAVDKAESDTEKAFSVNERAVELLALAAKEVDIPLFHISTDYIFDGKAKTPYKESDLVNPTSVYGSSKLAGEQALASVHAKHIILRTSWVFGANGNNFVKTMLRLGKERDELGIVSDQYGCPTSAASIASALWQLALMYNEHSTLSWGVYNYSNSPTCTWYDFALEIFNQATSLKMLTDRPTVNAITTKDFPTPAKRPAWSVLDVTKIESLLGYKVPHWKEELSDVLRQL